MEGLAIFLVIRVIMGAIAAAIASSKGRTPVGWFFGGFFLDLIGIIIVACLSNLKEDQAYRDRQNRENRRLREQLRQERLKGEAFRQHTMTRLDTHDQQLGVDTKQTYAALPSYPDEQPGLLEQHESGFDALSGEADRGSGFAPRPVAASPIQRAASQAGPQAAVRQWHYETNGQALGPVPEPQLLGMLRAGQINAATLLWTEELGDWKPASQISALRPYIQA
jgi:hypothetical protein